MHTDLPNHPQAFLQMHTGIFQFARPCLGAWTLYGLGTENAEPARLRHAQPAAQQRRAGELRQRVPAGRLPGDAIGGDRFGPVGPAAASASVSNIKNPRQSTDAQRLQLDFVQSLNRDALERDAGQPGDRRGDRVVRAGLPHAGRAARS